MNFDAIFSLEPIKLIYYLEEEFLKEIPSKLETKDDLAKAGELLLQFGNSLAYLHELEAISKVKVREARRSLTKEEIDDMIDRKEVIHLITTSVSDLQSALSRAITVYKTSLEESRIL